MTRKVLLPVFLIGVALIVMPFALSMPSRAGAGQAMMDNFRPIMQSTSVTKTVNYYNQTFTPLRPVATGGVVAAAEVPKLIGALAKPLHMTPAEVQQFLGKNFPAMAGLLGNLPKLVPVFSKVPGGLDHYLPLVRTMQSNVSNYANADKLPSFRLLTWFFVIPGVLLVLLAAGPLVVERRRHTVAAAPAHAVHA